MCDVTNPASLDSIDRWRREFGASYSDTNSASNGSGGTNAASSNSDVDEMARVPCLLFANKCDVGDQRAISHDKLLKWSAAHGNMPFVETSALTSQNVDDAFMRLAQRLMQRENGEQ